MIKGLRSSAEVAKLLGLNRTTIRVYARKWGLGRKVAGRLFFTTADVNKLRRRPTQRGGDVRKRG